MNYRCRTCQYLDEITFVESKEEFGECRRMPPTPMQKDRFFGVWPIVEINLNWCGEYRNKFGESC